MDNEILDLINKCYYEFVLHLIELKIIELKKESKQECIPIQSNLYSKK